MSPLNPAHHAVMRIFVVFKTADYFSFPSFWLVMTTEPYESIGSVIIHNNTANKKKFNDTIKITQGEHNLVFLRVFPTRILLKHVGCRKNSIFFLLLLFTYIYGRRKENRPFKNLNKIKIKKKHERLLNCIHPIYE